MTFNLMSRAMHPESPRNADWVQFTPSVVILLDGAAPFGQGIMTSYENDAIWFVRRYAEVFFNEIKDNVTTAQCMERARKIIGDEYASVLGNTSVDQVFEPPFSCVTVLRYLGETLEILNAGDHSILVEYKDGTVWKFGQNAVRLLDHSMEQELKALIHDGIVSHEKRSEKLLPRILENRALRNMYPGYDVLTPSDDIREHLERALLLKKDVQRICALTDGLARSFEAFDLCDWSTFFGYVDTKGLENVIYDIREIEDLDPECVRYPRFKKSDDATGIIVEIL